MQTEQIFEKLYIEDGIRNSEFLNSCLHQDFLFEWESSSGFKTMDRNEIQNFANELKQNFHTSRISIQDKIITENRIVVRYLHHASTIENPNEIFTIAKIVAIWEIENNKIVKGYQISKPN
jgi:hypothetical protein